MADAVRGSIVINEVLPDPNSASGSSGPRFDTDQSGSTTPVDEFIEIYNSGSSAVNIGGLQLWDQTLGKWFTFPNGTILQPGGHAMVMTGAAGGPGPFLGPGDMAFYAGRGSAVLNNGPENAILYDPAANNFAQVAYGGAGIVTPGVPGAFAALPAGATRVGSGENFGAFTPGYSLQRQPDGGNTIISAPPNPANDNVCFGIGTLIATPGGPRPVETLRPGDLVLTDGDRALPILWAGVTHFAADRLWREPRLWPVTLRAGALAPGVPSRDLRLSRQHRLRLGGAIAARMGGDPYVLVPAQALIGLPGITLSRPEGRMSYFHLLLECHAVVLAEDTPAESLLPGPQAMAALAPDNQAQIARALAIPAGQLPKAYRPAHPLLGTQKTRRLLNRHQQNERPLSL